MTAPGTLGKECQYEIGSLTIRSFDLDSNPATVTVEAAYSKRRRQDKQVLHPVVVERLRHWLQDREPADGELLFPIDKRTCGTDRRTAKMMAEDLAAARRKWLAESNGDRLRREKSDFLKYVDSQGRYADFHSNRHTFITNLSMAGVSAPPPTRLVFRTALPSLTFGAKACLCRQ